jgi:hypothetical protein
MTYFPIKKSIKNYFFGSGMYKNKVFFLNFNNDFYNHFAKFVKNFFESLISMPRKKLRILMKKEADHQKTAFLKVHLTFLLR